MKLKDRKLRRRFAASALALGVFLAGLAEAPAQPAPGGPRRIALVIGEAAYRTGPLSSSANDAGLIADTLQLAGFDVTGAADLDQEGLRRSLREFVDKAAAAGPDALVFVYLAGRAVQYEGENYFAPIEATIPRAANVPLEAVRLSDYLQPLAQMPLKARIVVLDAARINGFAPQEGALAGGLALVEPTTGGLYAFNAAPGSVAPNETGPYGAYAQALTEMLREGGLPVDQAFARARLRVSEQTRGAQIPWDESKLAPAPVLFARAPGAPPPTVALETQGNLRARPIREYPVDQAYAAALEQDTLAAYTDFLNAYPNSPYAGRVHVMLAARREALTWRRAYIVNTPNAYWTYLQRYSRGPHAEDARRRLAVLNAALMPPPRFDVYEFDVPPPVEEEEVYFRRPYVVFDDADYGPPPPMGYLLPPPPILVERAPPPPPYEGLLPLPLVAAPLLFAIPAVRQGVFRAPAVVQTQQPGANNYYQEHYSRPPGQPGGNPPAPALPGGRPPAAPGGAAAPPAAPMTPAGAQNGAPLPHAGPQAPALAPNSAPLSRPTPPAPAAAPNGAPLPHAGPQAPAVAPNAAPLSRPTPPAPAAAPNGAPLPHAGPQAPAVAPNAAPLSRPTPPAPAAAPNGAPLPHAGPQAPAVAPNAAPLSRPTPPAPAAAPNGAPLPHAGPQAPALAPNAAPLSRPTPPAPAAAPNGAPLPHAGPQAPAVAPNAAPLSRPTPPAPAAAPNGAPLPHAGPQAPAVAPNAAPLSRPTPPAPAAAPNGAPLPHVAPHVAPQAPPAPHVAPQAPRIVPQAQAPHVVPQAPPAPNMAPPAPRIAPQAPPPPHMAPPAPHVAPQAPPPPRVAPQAPPAPHVAPPPPHVAPPAPRMAPQAPPPQHMAPQGPAGGPRPGGPPHERPGCGGPGQPPCH